MVEPDLTGAESVETVVTPERGRWVVEIVVVFADGVVRHRVADHPTRARAEIAARLVQRGADRDAGGPLRG